ncbi:TPA: DNA polymerase III subunit epsilon [Escherichia coli]|nr:DNA polymerase III subunit epsilon [Escherichia coli]
MAKRKIVFDLETTGFHYKDGDRVIEFAGVEIIDNKITGNNFAIRINPEGRKSDPSALAVHGITDESLVNEPTFKQALPKIIDFIRDAEIIAHNAAGFDESFFNYEIKKSGHPESLWQIVDKVTDSLILVKSINPGLKKANLDVLCDMYGVDRSARTVHGALIDCELLAQVYLKMLEGVSFINREEDVLRQPIRYLNLSASPLGVVNTSEVEQEHENYLNKIEKANKKPAFEREINSKSSAPKM